MELIRDVNENLCYIAPDFVTTQSSIRLRKPTILRLASSKTVHHRRGRRYFHCLKCCSSQVSLVKELAASTTLTPATICTSMSSGILFQRIVERMTKELTTDPMYDDDSSRRRRCASCREGQKKKKKSKANSKLLPKKNGKKKKSKANSRQKKNERGWSGRTRSIARGARDCSARRTELAS